MKPVSVGELAMFLGDNFTCAEICDMLDLHPEELVCFLAVPIEEKFDEVVEEIFGTEEEV